MILFNIFLVRVYYREKYLLSDEASMHEKNVNAENSIFILTINTEPAAISIYHHFVYRTFYKTINPFKIHFNCGYSLPSVHTVFFFCILSHTHISLLTPKSTFLIKNFGATRGCCGWNRPWELYRVYRILFVLLYNVDAGIWGLISHLFSLLTFILVNFIIFISKILKLLMYYICCRLL